MVKSPLLLMANNQVNDTYFSKSLSSYTFILGDYHIHLAGVGDASCQIDSDAFKLNAAKTIQQATTNNLQQTGSNESHQVDTKTIMALSCY